MHSHSLDQWTHDHIFLGQQHAHNERRTWFVVALTAIMMVGEIVAGTLFGSMALLADGWHMATHAAALGIAALAYLFARRQARNTHFTFGTGKYIESTDPSPAYLTQSFYGIWDKNDANPIGPTGGSSSQTQVTSRTQLLQQTISNVTVGTNTFRVVSTNQPTWSTDTSPPQPMSPLARTDAVVPDARVNEPRDVKPRGESRRRKLEPAVGGEVRRRVAQAEVGGEIEDLAAARQEIGRQARAFAMRQRREDHAGPGGDDVGVGGLDLAIDDAGELREHGRDRLPSAGAGVQAHDLDERVLEEQADELGAGVARGADDGDGGHGAASIASIPAAKTSGGASRPRTR